MKSSQALIEIIKEFEGFEPKPYLCPAGVPTIGYGSTRYFGGKPVKLTDSAISEKDAVALLNLTLEEYENAVNRYVAVHLNQNQFDALVDFAYNCGAQNLRKSTLLKKLNTGDYFGAAEQFGAWVFGNGKRLNGLVRRREAERQLFMKDS